MGGQKDEREGSRGKEEKHVKMGKMWFWQLLPLFLPPSLASDGRGLHNVLTLSLNRHGRWSICSPPSERHSWRLLSRTPSSVTDFLSHNAAGRLIGSLRFKRCCCSWPEAVWLAALMMRIIWDAAPALWSLLLILLCQLASLLNIRLSPTVRTNGANWGELKLEQ